MFCMSCGASYESGRFCRSCGKPLPGLEHSSPAAVSGRRGGATIALFHSSDLSNADRNLNGHVVAAVFGEAHVYFGGRPLPLGETKITLTSIFGGIDVYVPVDVAIKVTGLSVFSGVKIRGQLLGNGMFSSNQYTAPGYAQAARRLHIEANSVFGGIKVKR